MKYNLHSLLYDLTRGHFKSKLLCKLGWHNYIAQYKATLITTEENTPYVKVICNNKKYDSYYQCYCCNKEISLER